MSELGKSFPTNVDKLKSEIEGSGSGGSTGLVVSLTASNDNSYTGDKSVAEIKSVIDGGGCVYLSYPDGDMRIIAEYVDDTSLRIGVFSEDEYIVYSVVDDGSNGITLTVVSTKYMAEPFVVVPTFTSQTGGTVPAGTFNRLKRYVEAGIVGTADVSPIYRQAPGTTISQFMLNGTGSGTTVVAYAYNVLPAEHKVVFSSLVISSNDTFTVSSLEIS